MHSTIALSGNHKLAEPLYGRMKRIQVFENGEQRCYLLNIVPRNFRSWNAVLQHITNVIRPNFGPVKKLVALRTCRCVETFEELDSCEKYIALGLNGCLKMVRGGYRDSCRQKWCCKQLYRGQLDSQMSCFLRETKKKGLTIIYVVRNGICIQVPSKIVLRKHDLQSWDLILRFLSKKLDIPEGAAFICTIFGEMLCDPRELQHGYVYVVIPYQEDFIKLDYLQCFQYLCCLYRRNYVVNIKPASSKRNKKCRYRKKIESCCVCDITEPANEPCTCVCSPRNFYVSKQSTDENICGCLDDISSSDIVIFQNNDFEENGTTSCLPCCCSFEEEDSYEDFNVKDTILFYTTQSDDGGNCNACCPLLISNEPKDRECCQCFTCQRRKIVQDVTCDSGEINLNSDKEGNIEKTSLEGCFYEQMLGKTKSKTLCCQKNQKEPNDYSTRPLSCCQSYCCVRSTGTSDPDGSGYEPNPSEEDKKELCDCSTCQNKVNEIAQELTCGTNNLVEGCFYKQMLGRSKSKTLCCPKNRNEPNDYNSRPLSCCQSYCCVGRKSETGNSDGSGRQGTCSKNSEDVDENISCLNNSSSGKLDIFNNNKKPEYIKDYCTLMNILREYGRLHTTGRRKKCLSEYPFKKKFRSRTCCVCRSSKNIRTQKMKSCPNLKRRRKLCNKGKMPVKTIPSMFIEPTPVPRLNYCNTLAPMPPCCFFGLGYCQNRFC